jgi:hypothetical protein
MPWQVGIDEAGYGPNLGPLVMTVVACRVPDPDSDLWHDMRAVVRRHGDEDDGRLLVADSKLVFTPDKGLRCLEQAVLALLCGGGALAQTDAGLRVLDVLTTVGASSLRDMHREAWFSGATRLPTPWFVSTCVKS